MGNRVFGLVLCTGLLLVSTLAVLDAQDADGSVLPLPNWEQEEVQIFPLGGGLLPAEGGQKTPSERNESGLFIPNRGVGEPSRGGAPEQGMERPLVVVDAKFLDRMAARAPEELILDPDGLVGPAQLEEFTRLLATQTEQGVVNPNLTILPEGHRLPEKLDIGNLGRLNQMSKGSCMVVYPFGEPWRVRLFMSRRVTEVVERDYLSRLAQACVQDAMKAQNATEQLKRFVIQLCIRLTWMEREHALMSLDEEDSVLAATETSGSLMESSALGTSLPEVMEVTPNLDSTPVTDQWEQWWPSIRPWIWKSILGLVALNCLWLTVKRLIQRFKQRGQGMVWMLPEKKSRPRLGGKYCGGGGASTDY